LALLTLFGNVILGLRSLRSLKHATRAARVGTPLTGATAAAPRLIDAFLLWECRAERVLAKHNVDLLARPAYRDCRKQFF